MEDWDVCLLEAEGWRDEFLEPAREPAREEGWECQAM